MILVIKRPFVGWLTVVAAAIVAPLSGSLQVVAPPRFPLEVAAPATLRTAPVSSVHLGSLIVYLDKTTLPEVIRAIGVGAQDSDTDGLWVCYSMSKAGQRDRIWLLSDHEMGGDEHTIQGVAALQSGPSEASPACPELPERFKPVRLDVPDLWLGSAASVAERRLGKPSLQQEAWRHYESERTIRESRGTKTTDWIESGGLSIRIEANKIVELWALKSVSN